MRLNKKYSFDEETEARNIIENGFPEGKINFIEMQKVAKYYREVFGYGRIRLEREIIYFCKKQNPDFNPIIEKDTINRWIKSAMNYKLRKVDNINITHSEMDKLKEIKNLKNRKLLFATLVLSKAIKKGKTGKDVSDKNPNKFFIGYSNFTDISKLAQIKISEIALADIFHELEKEGLLTFYNAERESILINFASDDGNNAMTITKPEQCMEYYKIFFGGDTIYCSNCGKEITKKANAQVRCNECAKEEAKKIKAEWWRKNKGRSSLEQMNP